VFHWFLLFDERETFQDFCHQIQVLVEIFLSTTDCDNESRVVFDCPNLIELNQILIFHLLPSKIQFKIVNIKSHKMGLIEKSLTINKRYSKKIERNPKGVKRERKKVR
jgi:hypothetical protein